MSPARRVWVLVGALALLTVLAIRCDAQRDTTVCTAFRTRTGATGAVLSTSVAKVVCGGAARVDTVKVPVPVPVQSFVYWQPNVAGCRVAWEYALGTSSPPPAVTLTGCGTVRVDTVRVPGPPSPPVHDTVYVVVPPPAPPPVPPWRDTTGLVISDLPSRVGENNVFQGTAYLGRVMVDSVGQWFAYRYTAGQSLMPKSGPYPSQAAAMAALAAP